MKTTLVSLGIIAIAAISVSSCESGKARVAKMEQISINGKDYRLEMPEWEHDNIFLHPEGSNGEGGYLFKHKNGPIYVSFSEMYAWDMFSTGGSYMGYYENDELEKRLVFNLDLKKIIFATEWDTYFRIFLTQELVVPGGKVHGVILTAYHPMTERAYHRKVYTLDGVLRYDNKNDLGVARDIVIERGYIYLAQSRYNQLPAKEYKILPDGSKERVPYELREPDPEKSVTGGSWEEDELEIRRMLSGH